MNYAASTFVANTSTGNQAVSGLGFQPKALRIVAVLRSAVGTGTPGNISWAMTDGTNVRCQYAAADDNVTTSNTYGGANTTDIVHLLSNGTPTTDSIATFVSFDSDGFTINWTTAPGTAWLIFYEAWGGADITNVTVGTWAPSGTGSKSLTGLGFQPDVLFWMCGKTAGVDALVGVGAASGSGAEYGDSAYSGDNVTGGGNVVTRAYHKAASILCLAAGGGINAEATLTSFDSDGWTYNFTSNANSPLLYYMAIKGGHWKVGAETSKTGTAPQTKQTTGIGFQPLGLSLFGAYLAASSTVVQGSGQVGFGGATALNTGKGLGVQWGNTSPWRSSQGLNSDPIYTPNATGSAAGLVGDLSAWDSDSFSITYSTTAATAREFGYVAFKSSAQTKTLTAAAETDAAQALSFTQAAQSHSITAAAETDAAQALAKTQTAQTKTLTAAGETDAAQALSYTQSAQSHSVTAAVETDAAQALATSQTPQSIAVTAAAETDTSRPLSFTQAPQTVAITWATETDTAVALTATQTPTTVSLSAAIETDTAVSLGYSTAFALSIIPASETDTAVALSHTSTTPFPPGVNGHISHTHAGAIAGTVTGRLSEPRAGRVS